MNRWNWIGSRAICSSWLQPIIRLLPGFACCCLRRRQRRSSGGSNLRRRPSHGDGDGHHQDRGGAWQPLPCDLVEYEHQVGGHGLLYGEKARILAGAGVLYKPVQREPKGWQEVEFYQVVAPHKQQPQQQQQRDTLLEQLAPFLPAYLGLFRHRVTGRFFIGMEDVLQGIRRPCVMDCKMGGRSTPPGASASKHLLQRAMYTHRERLGFIITGFKVFPGAGKKPRFYSIMHGRSLDEEGVFAKGFVPFLTAAGPVSRVSRIAAEVVQQLEQLQAWFCDQRHFQFYASSLLIAYESQPAHPDDLGVVVRMVDFAHARYRPAGGSLPDRNYQLGLSNLIAYYRRAICELCQTEQSPGIAVS